MKILFVASEAYPLVKTGGLGDVCGSLPPALKARGADVRLLLPAYRDALPLAGPLKPVATFALVGAPAPVTLLEGVLPGTRVPLWLVDCPPAFDRPGNPYLDEHGQPWHDNALRFALLARAAEAIALGQAGLRWRPAIVHSHDWQAGLVPALLATAATRPATVFTIHNLAYQGVFPRETFSALGLPTGLWSMNGVEFHGQMSFIKGGLAYADCLTTVSPTYAHEIQTPAFGCGLEGLLHHRRAVLHGILNGIDTREWNPARDARLAKSYSASRLAGKAENKRALQRAFGLPESGHVPLIGMVGRLVTQKGFDIVLAALPALARLSVQLVALGTGETRLERLMREAASRHTGWFAVRIGYDEAAAHRIQAGADMFLMPSRFEPCGLSQLHSLRYGTVPIVRRVGGLADTVADADPERRAQATATGIVFDGDRPADLIAAVERAVALYRDAHKWQSLMRAGMRQDFSWRHSAAEYLALYERLLRQKTHDPLHPRPRVEG
jgi:starch synthase